MTIENTGFETISGSWLIKQWVALAHGIAVGVNAVLSRRLGADISFPRADMFYFTSPCTGKDQPTPSYSEF